MQAELKHLEDAIVASPSGRLDSTNAMTFQSVLLDAIETGKNIVVDCSNLAYISSAGLRSLLVAAKAAESKRIAFSICALAPNVREVFSITGFDKIIRLHGDLDAALSDHRHSPS